MPRVPALLALALAALLALALLALAATATAQPPAYRDEPPRFTAVFPPGTDVTLQLVWDEESDADSRTLYSSRLDLGPIFSDAGPALPFYLLYPEFDQVRPGDRLTLCRRWEARGERPAAERCHGPLTVWPENSVFLPMLGQGIRADARLVDGALRVDWSAPGAARVCILRLTPPAEALGCDDESPFAQGPSVDGALRVRPGDLLEVLAFDGLQGTPMATRQILVAAP